MTNDLAHWLRLWHVPGIGPRSFNFLLEKFDQQPEYIFSCSYTALIAQGIPERIATAITSCHSDEYLRDLEWLDQCHNHHILTISDKNYPPLLAKIAAAPPILYIKGQLEALDPGCRLAIVGARKSTTHGKSVAYDYSHRLAELGVTVVSGLAKGIDAQAHRGALASQQGCTIAVLANGLDTIYPAQHYTLAQAMQERGALISEFPPGVKPLPGHFPRRNRIISGLCLGTVVIEASMKSGSLITAQFALEQGREIFAVPGPVNNPLNSGSHHLIQQGASLAACIEDILLAFEPLASFLRFTGNKESERVEDSTDNTTPLLQFIEYTPTSIDTIIEKSGLTPDQVCSMLTELEIGGRVVCDAYGQYSRS